MSDSDASDETGAISDFSAGALSAERALSIAAVLLKEDTLRVHPVANTESTHHAVTRTRVFRFEADILETWQ
jgi:hypothetical protein